MNNKVNIIHGSSIIQNGLSDILSQDFKCSVSCYPTFEAYLEESGKHMEKCIFFTEDTIANSDFYLKFINKLHKIQSYSIVYNKAGVEAAKTPYTIFIYDTPQDIYNQVKATFQQQIMADEPNEGLSAREVEVLKLVALGFANKEIAEKLFISTHTVMSHRKNITEKLGIKSISGLTVYAIINNYIDTTNLNVKDLI